MSHEFREIGASATFDSRAATKAAEPKIEKPKKEPAVEGAEAPKTA